jgi:16S rRNA processing protein RimM
MAEPELLVVGRIQRPHGLSGEVSVEIRTAFPERFVAGERLIWRREGEAQKILTLTGARAHGDRMLLRFEGVADVETARPLLGGDLCVPRTQAFPAPEDFYYIHEIRGFACEDRQGKALGRAVGVEQTPAGPLLSVELPSGKEALIPFVAEMVRLIDREARKIVLDLPDGLLDL